ncbi:MAG: protein kinase domain-containing protein [Hyalangium sp.]|uniref:protein kinase domain-containing protein n=1 Tax=Hyalangium sp. TaxID=2028555 RepID=UPI00389A11BE
MKRPPSEEALSTSTFVREDAEENETRKESGLRGRTFLDGAMVAGRYHVVRFVAQGSQGEVYAVEDTALRERVALKTIRMELASRPDVLKRFKDELRLARRVTHPNVCRVFDLGEHRGELELGRQSQPVTFLTMEMLEGETLHEYVARNGRIPPAQLLPLAEQMASALDAAHEAQIVHRDFKSSNVVLLQSRPSSTYARVVVTDFGLALGMAWKDTSESWRGGFIGTPSYMAPEQVRGEAVSPASDIYSFGVVLYEMATGRLPFIAETVMATALQRLQGPPPPPRTWAPELEPHWDQVLLRCLAQSPRERFATASEVVDALRGKSGTFVAAPPLPGPAAPANPAPVPVTRKVVAVLAPHSLWARAETAWMSTAFAEMLSAELAAGGQVRLLSGEEVAQMRRELALPESESFSADTLRRIRAHSGADLVLSGTYLALGHGESSTLRMDLRLQDSSTGEASIRLTEVGTERELLTFLSRVGSTLRERLGLMPLTSEEVHQVRHTMPASAEVTRLYAEGLACLRAHDVAAAVKWLEQVTEREPTFALAHSALAAAYQRSSFMERAKVAARRAFELSQGLPPEERLLVRARHHEAQAEWTQAIEAYQQLLECSPDTVEYGVALVSAQVCAGQVRDALATVEALRRLPPPMGNDSRIDLAAANAQAFSSDFTGSYHYASVAVDKARQAGQGGIAATALLMQSGSLRNLGNVTHAASLLEEAERLFLESGNHGGALRAMYQRAITLVDRGKLREAESVYGTAIRRVSSFRGSELEADILANAAWVYCHLGDLAEALRLIREAMELYRRLELIPEVTHYSIQLGMVRRHQGAMEEARHLLEQAAQAAREAVGDEFTEAWAQYELGQLFFDQGELSRARAHLDRALLLRRGRRLQAFAAETELSLARVAVEEGKPDEALRVLEQVLAAYAEPRTPDKEGLARAIMAQALLAKESLGAAREAIVQARSLAGQSENFVIMAEVALTYARCLSRSGTLLEREETSRHLQALFARARQGGLKSVELQARLALAELEETVGEVSLQATYLAIAGDANQLGYMTIARRAEAATRR